MQVTCAYRCCKPTFIFQQLHHNTRQFTIGKVNWYTATNFQDDDVDYLEKNIPAIFEELFKTFSHTNKNWFTESDAFLTC